MKSSLNLSSLVCTAAFLLTIAGCGEADPFEHVGVSGKVTLNGEPLKDGTITFIPTATGAGAHTEITGGTYKISSSEGPGPGNYRVEISRNIGSGRKVPDPEYPGQLKEETFNSIPPQYNVSSSLKVDIKNEAEQTFDFALEAKTKGK